MSREDILRPRRQVALEHLRKQHPDPHEAKIKAHEDGPLVLDDFDDGWPVMVMKLDLI